MHLCYAGLVQVAFFLQRNTARGIAHTLSAVSAQMRVEAEVVMSSSDGSTDQISILESSAGRRYRIQAATETQESLRLAHSLWWAHVRPLPVVCVLNNARGDVLQDLTHTHTLSGIAWGC